MKSNKIKAMDELNVASLGFFAHTLQLVVHEGSLAQRCQWCPGEQQEDCRAFQVFVPGYYMLAGNPKRLEDAKQTSAPGRNNKMEQRILYDQEPTRAEALNHGMRSWPWPASDTYCKPVGFTGKNKTVLAPFEELTKLISSTTSSTAEVIPSVTVVKCLLTWATEQAGDKNNEVNAPWGCGKKIQHHWWRALVCGCYSPWPTI